jgi:hypothetical protein
MRLKGKLLENCARHFKTMLSRPSVQKVMSDGPALCVCEFALSDSVWGWPLVVSSTERPASRPLVHLRAFEQASRPLLHVIAGYQKRDAAFKARRPRQLAGMKIPIFRALGFGLRIGGF